nr:MAG TPA: tail tape measure [Caudoviricetes sp.]
MTKIQTGIEIKADVSGAENVGRLADETEKAAQAAQKMKQAAEAKAVLGIKTAQARWELAKVNQAYAELKASGTLTKRELKQATAAYTARVRELKAELKGVPSKLNPIAASVRGMGGAMLGVAGVGGGLYAVKEGLQQVVQATAEYAAIRSRMEYAFGGTEAAGVQMQWVKGLAEELGLEVRTLADGYAQLASATKNIGFTTGQTQQVFKGVAAAAAKMNLSTDETNGVLLALSQIAGKGKVSMEELRGQLGERLTPAMAIAAKSMGVTTAELEKMVESGISAEAFLPKFGAAMEEAFAGAESAQASVNRLKNQFDELLLKFGEEGGINAAYQKLLDDVGAGLSWIEEKIGSLDGALTGGLSDGLTSAYELIKEVGAEAYEAFGSLMDTINECGNALLTVAGIGGNGDFDLLKGIIDGLNIGLGTLRDGAAGLGIAFEAAVGVIELALSSVAKGLAAITFGDLSANFEQAAEEMLASADKHFGKAQEKALAFESKTAEAVAHAAETEAQRFARLEAEARTAYQAAAQSAIDAAARAVQAQQAAQAAVGTAQEAAAAKAAQEAEKASSAAKREAQKTEEAWVKAFEKTGGSAEELAKIKQPLRDAGIVADETAAKVGNIGGEAQKAAQAVEAAFAKIGVDVGQVTDGIGQKARQAFKDFQTASDEAKKAGIEHSALIRAGFEQMMAKLESRQEFAAFERQLKQSGDAAALTREQMQRLNDAAKNGAGEAKTAYDRLAASIKNAASAADLQRAAAQAKEAFKNGIITAAQYDQAVAQAKVRTDELAASAAAVGQQAETGYAQASQAAERYGHTVRQAADGHKEVGHAAQASAQTAGGAWGKMTVNVHDYLSMTREQIRAMGDAMKTLTPLGSIGTAGINGGFKEWAARVKTFKDGVREAEAATEALNRAVSDGTVNMEMINRATAAATLQFGRLDDATLDKLNAAVAAARDKMAALKDEAADTVAQLQTELARLRGDGEQARRLEEERKLRELNVKLAEAEAQGNSEAAARYRQAVSLQRQIYRERAEQEEQAEKARAENPQAGLAAAFEAAPPQIGIPLSDLQRLIEARDKRVAEAAAESVIAGLEAAFRRTV